jgi:aflatoxin B1 aldehyde reductase
VEVIKKAAEEEGITPTEASLRWMYFNSKLSGAKGDAVIIGASSITQCRENLLASRKGPLSEKLVNAFDEGYELVKSVQPPYFRGHFLL